MGITVCNYSQDVRVGGKFVVIQPLVGDDGVVAFSDILRDDQHRDIVARWRQSGRPGCPEGRIQVAGGGWWRLTDEVLVLYGQSMAYGRYDRAWLQNRLSPGQVFHERAIVCQ
ncbi:MAG: hypothetical protein LIP77_08600 [Planctomycetes bacterium]|nr:hypothetical protein [Planctomycetota bacterium]